MKLNIVIILTAFASASVAAGPANLHYTRNAENGLVHGQVARDGSHSVLVRDGNSFKVHWGNNGVSVDEVGFKPTHAELDAENGVAVVAQMNANGMSADAGPVLKVIRRGHSPWAVSDMSVLTWSMAAGKDRVFVTGNSAGSQVVRAYDLSGVKKWEHALPEALIKTEGSAMSAIPNGNGVYFAPVGDAGSSNSVTFATDEGVGNFTSSESLIKGAAIMQDGTLVMILGGQLVAIRDHAQVWEVHTENANNFFDRLLVSSDGNRLAATMVNGPGYYVLDSDGNIVVKRDPWAKIKSPSSHPGDLLVGEFPLWKQGRPVYSTPTFHVEGEVLFAELKNNRVWTLDMESGKERIISLNPSLSYYNMRSGKGLDMRNGKVVVDE